MKMNNLLVFYHRDLIVAENDAYIEDVMSERVISANVGDDQEDIAQLMRDYDFIAVPVVDYQNHLLGIITIDDILDVMDEEASEDYSRLAGVSDIDSTSDSVFKTASKRLPWLIVLTFLGMITATILGSFEDTLSQVALLAAFIPIISGMSGNSGTQSLAVSVRNISTGEINEQSKFKIALREAEVVYYLVLYVQLSFSNYCRHIQTTVISFNSRWKFDMRNDSRYISWFNDSFSNEQM